MKTVRQLVTLFNIKSGEERLIGLLVLLAFTLEIAFVLIQSMAFGIFIDEYGARRLPYAYISIAVFAPLAAVLYIRLGERVSFSTALKINLTFLAVISFLVWLGLESSFFQLVSFTLPLLYQVVINLGTLIAWQIAGRAYNFQEAKRLFPLLISGNWLANILGGLLVESLVRWVGATNLLFLATIIFGLAMIFLRKILHDYASLEWTMPPTSHSTHAPKQPKGIFHDRYVLLIFAYIILWWIAFFFLDNIFADGVAVRFANVNQLTAFRGQLTAITGIVALISSTLLTSRIIGRFGLQAGLMTEAITVTLVVVLLAIFGSLGGSVAITFALAALAKSLNIALGYSLTNTAYVIVYQPLPTTIRGSVQATADGIFQPIASGLAGLSLLALTTIFNLNYLGLSYAYLGVAIVWLIVIVLLSRDYVVALTQAITKRRLGESPTALADPTSIALLRSRLHDSHPGVAIYALTRLESLDQQTIINELPNLIQHHAPEVRQEAFGRVEKLKLHPLLNEVQNQLSVEHVSSVKEAALRALGAITGGKSFSLLIAALNETDVHSLRGALVGLLKYGNDSSAQQKLNELLTSNFNNGRNLAIEILGEINRPEFYPYLIFACDSPETSRSAELAFASIGTEALPKIETAFLSPDAPRQRLFILTKALGHIGGTRSQNILLSQMSSPDEELRSQLLNALSQSGYRTKDISSIQRALKAEVEQAAWYCAAQADLSAAHETTLLVAALEESLGQIRDRVLLLLSFVFNSDSIRHVRETFLFGSAAQLSYALEIMDTQLPSDWKGWVMPLLEGLPPQTRSQRFAAFFPQAQARQTPEERLCEILENNHFSFWVRACAGYTYDRLFPAARKGDPAMLSTVERVLILKTVSMFSQTPDNVLADVANLLEEIDVSENETIFKQGDAGDSLYVILDGKVRVHDGEQLLNYLGERDVFGEMALLDPEPRLASVTAVEMCHLFRLDQASFYQLMAERPEVAMGIIRVLTSHLRNRVRDIAQLKARIKEFEAIKPAD